MKKLFVFASCLSLMASGSAIAAQQSVPQRHQVVKPGSFTDVSSRKKTKKHSSMKQSGMKPDASGQGGSGAGSDQGGTKAKNM